MSDALGFLITINAQEDELWVRWHFALGKLNNTVYRTLEADLEAIDGVESVNMQRYSCKIRLATHVTDAFKAAAQVAETLEDMTSEFRAALRFAFPDLPVTVTNAGRTVRFKP